MDNIYYKGDTSKILSLSFRSSTTGQLLTGITYSSVTIKEHRQSSSPTSITPVTMTAGTWTSSGFIETSDGGIYQFGIPNAGLASGADEVTYTFKATGALDVVRKIILLDANLRSASSGNLNVNASKVGGDSSAAVSMAQFFAGQISGTAQAGASDSITLASGSNSNNGFFDDVAIVILSGTGAGQVRRAQNATNGTTYNGTTKVLKVTTNWVTAPDNTSIYMLMGRIE